MANDGEERQTDRKTVLVRQRESSREMDPLSVHHSSQKCSAMRIQPCSAKP